MGQVTDLELLRKYLRQVEYKPNWLILVDGDSIVIKCTVQDSTKPGVRNEIGVNFFYRIKEPPVSNIIHSSLRKGNPEPFFKWLYGTINKIERHKTNEWFRINGELPYNPHNPDGTLKFANSL